MRVCLIGRAPALAILAALAASPALAGNVPNPDGTSSLQVIQTPNGTPVDFGNVSVPATGSTNVVPFVDGPRWRATIVASSSNAGTVWCRTDYGVPTVGVGVQLAPGGGYEWDFPLTGAAPTPPIACISSSGTALVSGEYVQ